MQRVTRGGPARVLCTCLALSLAPAGCRGPADGGDLGDLEWRTPYWNSAARGRPTDPADQRALTPPAPAEGTATWEPLPAADGPEASPGVPAPPVGPPSPEDGGPAAPEPAPGKTPLPHELAKTFLPPYVIEPPDVLVIDALRLVPRPPYRIEPLDVLLIAVTETVDPKQPIGGPYAVAPEGTVNLGYSYGAVRVAGLTLEEASAAVKNHLRRTQKGFEVSLVLAQFRGVQQTRGEHLVAMDGTINLGSYGLVKVGGLTVPQARCAVEQHLAQFLLDPLISLSVGGYNSKVYYVITDGAGYGEQVYRFPITGNETVLDAISQIRGLPVVASKKRIWLARPSPAPKGCYQILPVDWEVIAKAGSTETNYQVFPGDRIYINSDPLIKVDNLLAKVLSPAERLFGITLLGSGTINSIRNTNSNNGIAVVPIR